MKLLIQTGQRESEVAEADWMEFELMAGLWKISAARTKTERAQGIVVGCAHRQDCHSSAATGPEAIG